MVNKANDQDNSDQKIENLQNQIDLLKGMQSSDANDQQKINDLADMKINQINRKKSLVDRAYEKKGILFYWGVKLPLKNLNVASIAQTQKMLNNSVKGVVSPPCPKCSKGILMYDKYIVRDDGLADWFCSNGNCDYTITAKSSTQGFIDLATNSELHSTVLIEGRERWEKLTEDQKNNLAKEHLIKAKLYLYASLFMVLILVFQLFFHAWFGLLLTVPILMLVQLISIKWCYRAWQVKTGNVFLPQSQFFNWLKVARNFYSVDWLDEPNNPTKK